MSKGNIADELVKQLDNGAEAVAESPDLKNTEDEKLNISEAQVEKEFRSELVDKDDVYKVMDMDKVALQKYAHSRLGKELDLNKRIKQLKTDVVIMIQNKLNLPTDVVGRPDGLTEESVKERVNPEFIFNKANRRIFEWTELLDKRTDLIPCYVCDLEGKRL
jgi:hypothetical protein